MSTWPPTGVLWPDVEAAAVRYLTAALAARPEPVAAGVLVTAHKADGVPRQLVVRDDGGAPVADVRATALLGINVWAPTWVEASELSAMVTALINAWPDGRPVVHASARRGYPVADEAGPCRYLTAELVVRGTSI